MILEDKIRELIALVHLVYDFGDNEACCDKATMQIETVAGEKLEIPKHEAIPFAAGITFALEKLDSAAAELQEDSDAAADSVYGEHD